MEEVLNQTQIDWLCKKQNELVNYIESCFPPTEEQWEKIHEFLNNTINQVASKTTNGKVVQKVRSALFDVIEPYDRKINWG